HEFLADDIIGHLNGSAASVVHWAFGLCVPLRWPQGELREAEVASTLSAPRVQPSQAEPAIVQPTPRRDPDHVTVKVLERRDVGGKVQFFVQEQGKPRGVLAYGIPPPVEKLPQVGEDISVYRNNQDLRNPQY